MVMEQKHYEQFGIYIKNLAKIENYETAALGKAIEQCYLRVLKEAERDARDRANGKN
jgi:hypothetical protein